MVFSYMYISQYIAHICPSYDIYIRHYILFMSYPPHHHCHHSLFLSMLLKLPVLLYAFEVQGPFYQSLREQQASCKSWQLLEEGRYRRRKKKPMSFELGQQWNLASSCRMVGGRELYSDKAVRKPTVSALSWFSSSTQIVSPFPFAPHVFY